MPKALNLIGETYGRLSVTSKNLEKSGKGKGNFWNCKCICGNEVVVSGGSLRAGKVQSCGCLKKETDRAPKGNTIDLTGQQFGHLLVIQRDGSDNRGEAKWLCQCDCGNPILLSILGSNLRTGHTQSCGCERRSHGELKIAQILTDNNIPFEQEVVLFKYANNTNAKFDFYINKQYLIEYDGETHFKYNLHGWHTLERLKAQQERDMIKNEWCKNNNIPLIRIPYTHLIDLKIEDLLLKTSLFIIK